PTSFSGREEGRDLDAEPQRPTMHHRPRRRRSVGLWTAAAFLILVGSLGLTYQLLIVETDKGTLEIRAEDPNVQVLVTQNGKSIKIIDPTTDQHVELRSGDYELQLGGD